MLHYHLAMRIAFVGKGGSGKTTLSALFAAYAREKWSVLAIDADLNIHLPELLGFERVDSSSHISHPRSVETIRTHLVGVNERIKAPAHFRKTTPPGRGSRLLNLRDEADPIIEQFAARKDNLKLMVVGTYDTDDIGASCYHNNLAILENVLSHLVDREGVLVVDMVAGVDAFANTLHAQFDLLVLVVEPTRRGLEVYEHYRSLAAEAGVADRLFVVGNKSAGGQDAEFLGSRVDPGRLLGILSASPYLRIKDQEGGLLEIQRLEPENIKVIENIYATLSSSVEDPNLRLERLWDLHRRYVAQGFIRDRFGDLSGQIDGEFRFPT